MAIYLNYDGLAIKGDVTEEGHTDWIELSSCQYALSRAISSTTGASADRETSAPSISEVTITKNVDASTVDLVTEALQGEGKTAIIDFTKTDKGKLQVFKTLTLTDTMISSYSSSSDGNGNLQESVTLNFTQFELKYTPMKSGGAAGSPKTVTYSTLKGHVV